MINLYYLKYFYLCLFLIMWTTQQLDKSKTFNWTPNTPESSSWENIDGIKEIEDQSKFLSF